MARLVGQQQEVLAASAHSQRQGGRQERNGHHGAWVAAGLGLGLVGFTAPLLADEKKDKVGKNKADKDKDKNKADRVRQFATADNVFHHFASFQVVSDTGEESC